MSEIYVMPLQAVSSVFFLYTCHPYFTFYILLIVNKFFNFSRLVPWWMPNLHH